MIVLAVGEGWYRGSFGFARRTAIYGDRIGAIAQLEIDGRGASCDRRPPGRAGSARSASASIYDGTDDRSAPGRADVHARGLRGRRLGRGGGRSKPTPRSSSRASPPRCAWSPNCRCAPTHHGGRDAARCGAEHRRAGCGSRSAGRAGETRHRPPRRGARAVGRPAHRRTAQREGDRRLHARSRRRARARARRSRSTASGTRMSSAPRSSRPTAIAISSDLAPRSSFRSSHDALDQFHSNVFWSQRDNFVSVPTDCPQRDERLGWTGDAQAFSATASTLMDSEAFWASWLRDLEIDQTDEGGVASVVPDIIRAGRHADGRRADREHGPRGVGGCRDHRAARGVRVVRLGRDPRRASSTACGAGWSTCAAAPAPGWCCRRSRSSTATGSIRMLRASGPWEAKVSSDYVANAFYVQSARLLARAERLVGDPDSGAELRRARRRRRRRDVRAVGRRGRDHPDRRRAGPRVRPRARRAPCEAIAAGLAEDVRRENGRIATGFLGTPLVLFALSHHGYLDEAYLMLLRRDAPSWLYQVDRGATTVWERWDAILPDGTHPLRRDGCAAERRGGPRRGQHALVQPLRLRRHDRLGLPHRRAASLRTRTIRATGTVHVAPRPGARASTARRGDRDARSADSRSTGSSSTASSKPPSRCRSAPARCWTCRSPMHRSSRSTGYRHPTSSSTARTGSPSPPPRWRAECGGGRLSPGIRTERTPSTDLERAQRSAMST